MSLNEVVMLGSSSNRTKFYLYGLADAGLLPTRVVFLEDPDRNTAEQRARARQSKQPPLEVPFDMDLSMTVPEILDNLGVPYDSLETLDPNDQAVIDWVSEIEAGYVIFSGPGGIILRDPILSQGKRFLHVHPGYLPEYRGSTTIYYSLINEGKCGASAFFFTREIDAGPIIKRKYFPAPGDRETVDLYYDPLIRTKLLVEVLEEYSETGEFQTLDQRLPEEETYFIIHPLLKHMAILADRSISGNTN